MRESFKYILGDKIISREEASKMPTLEKELAKYEILAAVNDESEKDTIHAYKSEKDFEKWAKEAGYGDRLSILKQKMEEEIARPDDSQYEKEILDKITRSTEEIKKLSQELKLPSHSYEVIREAKKRGLMHSVWLYEHASFGGRMISLIPPGHRDFNRIGFNDITSSLVFGGALGALYEHPGFNGRSFYLAGLIWLEWIGAEFNDIATSYWEVP